MCNTQVSWTQFVQQRLYHPELNLALDFSRTGLSVEEEAALYPRMLQAFQAMQALEAGAIANPDEGRMVGHYWLRAPQLAPQPELSQLIRETQRLIADFAHQVHTGQLQGATGRFKHVLHIGIGGSALGPQLLSDALGSSRDRMQLWFLDNTDPQGFVDTLTTLQPHLGNTLVVVVSKSGGTPETRNGMLAVQARYREAGLPFAPHAVAITQQDSQLDRIATQEKWLHSFPMWDWVGGRTSVTSAVGLVPAALQGLDWQAFLAGAALMDQWTRNPHPHDNPAAKLALTWFLLTQGRGEKQMVILPYKDRLLLFSRYLQQLVMESLGKEWDRQGVRVQQGLTVYGNKGSTDQHAYVQQLREGRADFFVTFIRVLTTTFAPQADIMVEPDTTCGDYLHGFLLGTRAALWETGRPSLTITLNQLDPRSLGALIALYERAVGLYAELININAYHQPGVEAGKKAAAQVLALQRQLLQALHQHRGWGTAQEWAQRLASPESTEQVYWLLEHLSANRADVVCERGRTANEDRFRAT
ncbi:MAG: glucose-6-phosphate isomerase [Planctomycetaceae bacterium]|nr:MAG: glucose-6-phosphate isomerase [Planctomycetaceae bacterium]